MCNANRHRQTGSEQFTTDQADNGLAIESSAGRYEMASTRDLPEKKSSMRKAFQCEMPEKPFSATMLRTMDRTIRLR